MLLGQVALVGENGVVRKAHKICTYNYLRAVSAQHIQTGRWVSIAAVKAHLPESYC
jgi:hypothetical protein